ncbi:MAG: hypothetical protein HY831_01090 [Candidatus Aenigmarchaeota archaeon]|nr:hypothetical protein [Candidatus Aenigmarchaeota archaeon]
MEGSKFLKQSVEQPIDITRYTTPITAGETGVYIGTHSYARIRSGPRDTKHMDVASPELKEFLKPIGFNRFYQGIRFIVQEFWQNANDYGNKQNPSAFVDLEIVRYENGFMIHISDEGTLPREEIEGIFEKTLNGLRERDKIHTLEDLAYEYRAVAQEYLISPIGSDDEELTKIGFELLDKLDEKEQKEKEQIKTQRTERIRKYGESTTENIANYIGSYLSQIAIKTTPRNDPNRIDVDALLKKLREKGGYNNMSQGSNRMHAAVWPRESIGITRTAYDAFNPYGKPYANVYYDATPEGTTRANIFIKMIADENLKDVA